MHWSLTFVHLVAPKGAFFVLQKGFCSFDCLFFFFFCFLYVFFTLYVAGSPHCLGRPLGIEIQEFVVTYVVVKPRTSFLASIA